MHKTTARFWSCFYALPLPVQELARKNYELLKENPKHPSLHFKKVGKLWSARIGRNYRALGVEGGGVGPTQDIDIKRKKPERRAVFRLRGSFLGAERWF